MGPELDLSAVGDVYLGAGLPIDAPSGFAAAIEFLRGARARFANIEVVFHDGSAPPAAQVAGAWACAPEAVAAELVRLGINLASTAHNHAGDYGAPAMASTRRCLDGLGIVNAGTGEDLADARRHRLLQTNGVKVALVAATTTTMPHAAAGHTRADARGRPGVNGLRFATRHIVDAIALAGLERMVENLPARPFGAHRERPLAQRPSGPGQLWLGEQLFVRGEAFSIASSADPRDLADLAVSIAAARAAADFVVFSVHSHEFDSINEEPPAFLVEYCRAAIEAGADIVVGHGPHILRGIELYRSRPILYSLGAFLFQPYRFPRQPADFFEGLGLDRDGSLAEAYAARRRSGGFFDDPHYWQTVAARFVLGDDGGELSLLPVQLIADDSDAAIGMPTAAAGAPAAEIIGRLAELSARLGTTMDIDLERARASIRIPPRR